ncbi:MAG: acylphosphatase [Vicinamibacterales bacterium]
MAGSLAIAMRIARRYIISGRVQGVGFRHFAWSLAEREAVHGWVRNTVDGRVEIAVEGEDGPIDRFERGIRQGPPGARVDHVEVEATTPSGHNSGFIIR